MKQESIDFLTSHLQNWNTYKAVSVWPHLPTEDSQRLLDIAREFDPNYTGVIWCQSCLEDVVKFVFRNFEKTEAYKEFVKEPQPEKTVIEAKFKRK